jgi:hypothetical protein
MTAIHPPDQTRQYRIAGMTFEQCVLSVRSDVSDLPGVDQVA